jgi:hypothetical protein
MVRLSMSDRIISPGPTMTTWPFRGEGRTPGGSALRCSEIAGARRRGMSMKMRKTPLAIIRMARRIMYPLLKGRRSP